MLPSATVLAREYCRQTVGVVPLLCDGDIRVIGNLLRCVPVFASRYSPNEVDVPVNRPCLGSYLNYLHMGEATLTFPQTLVLRYTHFESAERRQPQVATDYSRWFLARLRAVDAALNQQDYICANRFTAADVSVGYALQLAEHLGFKPEFAPNVAAYWERLKQRPAFQRALQVQHEAALAQGVPTVPSPDIR
ncbi:MAG: glutathione S-transferase family protein [Polaromonas sp.]|nr:glutathione S-transferase family protein [Polaromonas sp.]